MRYINLFAILKAVLFTSGLVSLVIPQLATAQTSKRVNLALYGNSSARLESRTVENDYRQFFRAQRRPLIIFTEKERFDPSIATEDYMWMIGDRWRLRVDEPLVNPRFPLPILPNAYGDLDTVTVLYVLLEF